jgi:periplasmic protein TonB
MFDSVLKPGETLPKRRFWSGTVLGIAVYAGLAAFAVWAQASGKKADRQDVQVTFVKPPPPPPPPPPPAAPRQARPKPKPNQPQTVLSQAIVAPTQVPQEKPPEQEPVDMGNAQGTEGGIEGGEVGGVPGGIVGGVVDSSNVRMEFDERMSQPEKLGGPDPQYTEKAIEREVQGTMIVRCVVTIEGRVHDCRVLKSLPFMDRAVIDALERRRYKPATLGGRPVEVNYNFKITLKLPD